MQEGTPRLRFAPSPTGYLHIGGVRTALFNYLWAKKTGGKFIVRIEDTDRERSTEENEQIVLDSLRWLGLEWDEGPGVEGPHGPYRQMDRLNVYQQYADKLVERGGAYRCYCTKEELDAQRKALTEKDPKAKFRYPGTCRNRSGAAPEGPWVLRLKAPSEGSITYRDLVFGEIVTPNSAAQDVVLMRTDGVPLYNLGAVVDDITMGITIVARGRDHMINTPLQIMLYEALGAPLPQFAHLPMMLAPNGQKLSKRHGAVSVSEYRDQGIRPAALLNYLVRFGWSFGDQEIFSLPDLIEKFDWKGCSRPDGKFDQKKLSAISFEHLKTETLTSTDAYVDEVRPYLDQRGISSPDEAGLRAALPLVRERAQTLVDAAFALDYFFREEPVLDEKAQKKFLVPEKATHLPALREMLGAIDDTSADGFSSEALETRVAAWLESKGLAMKDFAQTARVALTGRTASPGLYDVMQVLGKARTLARLDRAIALSSPKPS